PGLIAQHANQHHESGDVWNEIPVRARKRLRHKARKWLNTRAVEQMTATRLAERDASGEVRGWLATIAKLGRRWPISSVRDPAIGAIHV
ncbi:MAG: hypothetical protein ABSG53_22885, partial [Thermoguttaceae bacterium]